ncbi:GNAT family N-acetyltransferase [Marimonas arenosa]|uniref:GNAT family N-acetyltransferase n=1 Tax=Marimonas arenosa TaxID=1795305 RepID=A0AAE3WGT1_9RHOB|nr:N-acetyltransferase [Marimonas arenosa]MDQ2092130.1 GNAT family N-acetyltransferase [Marimonas arenosa]
MTPENLATLHARAFKRQRAWSAAEFAALLNSDHVFLCPGPHGFALGRAVADEAELLTITTDPDRRRQGHARACLLAFETQARARGAARAILEVDHGNSAAIALYQSAGYDTVATRPAYYGLRNGTRADALIMAKSLKDETQFPVDQMV